jgi:trehalose 6-phosphate synthase
MTVPLRFVIALVVGLAVLAGIAWFAVGRVTTAWFDKDLGLRAELALSGRRHALIEALETGSLSRLADTLEDVTRDERILGAALCDGQLRLVARSSAFPGDIACEVMQRHVRPPTDGTEPDWRKWRRIFRLPGGRVHASALPLGTGSDTRGFAILVHDLSFVDRRDASLRNFLLLAFVVLALAASGTTLLAARIMWKDWNEELQRLARGEGRRPEFAPVVSELRALLERLATEEDSDLRGGSWTPERLKLTLSRHLHGERIVIVANREPYIHQYAADGAIRVLHPASGLVTALEPIMRACSGVWVAHGGGSADRAVVDARSRLRVPPGDESYVLRRVWLSEAEELGYYYGFANEGVWPLCHVAHARPIFRIDDWEYYKAVNQRFVDAICEEVDSDDPVVLIQDYHFALAPRLLRERLPRATILTFWHIPWPNPEQLGICPWRRELIEGMLGSSIMGFHTQLHCNNFLDSADRFLESRIDREDQAIVQRRRKTLVRAYPISIEWPSRWARAAAPVAECRASVLEELGLPKDALLGVGVDRLDYTKGLEERLLGVERLLERQPELRGRFSFVELAAPSRTLIERYRQLNETVELQAERINARLGTPTYRPIILLRQHHEPQTVFRYYRAADLCYVSSLHDGMNLVAKEFIAARDDERGVLLLSQFTGAARELTEALIVNPYDLEQVSTALGHALRMAPEEQAARLRAMRSMLAEFNVYRWAGRMLVDAARLRRHEQLSGRLSETDDGPRGT